MNNCKAQILATLASREAHVAVIGLGYVGLPLAVVFAEAGYCVTGIELDARKVVAVNKGESYIDDVKSRTVKELVSHGRLSATSDFAVLERCDALSICVPTPLRKTGDPDISDIISVSEQIARYLHPELLERRVTECVLKALCRRWSAAAIAGRERFSRPPSIAEQTRIYERPFVGRVPRSVALC
jgi:hypothetical protein